MLHTCRMNQLPIGESQFEVLSSVEESRGGQRSQRMEALINLVKLDADHALAIASFESGVTRRGL